MSSLASGFSAHLSASAMSQLNYQLPNRLTRRSRFGGKVSAL
jgi:hypothetical protein